MIEPISSALTIGIGAWATMLSTVGGVAIVRAALHRKRTALVSTTPAPPSSDPPPRVLVMRPCAGLEPHLARSLSSTSTLRYDGPLRVVLSTSTADDPARAVQRQVADGPLATVNTQVLVAPTQPGSSNAGANLKASQLAAIIDGASDDIALVVDSDVDLDGLDLDALLRPLRRPENKVGAVWCPPVEREPKTLGDTLSAALLGGSLHAFALLGTLDPKGLVGKTFAVRLDALRQIGGFGDLVWHLGEDMELSRRLGQAGWMVKRSDVPVASLASGRSVRQVVARYSRWMMVIRSQRPALLLTYPLLIAGTPMLLLAAALAASFGVPGMGLAATVAVSMRLAVAIAARVLSGRTARVFGTLADTVLADGLMLLAFARAAFGPARVRWRQRWIRIGPRGRLVAPHGGRGG